MVVSKILLILDTILSAAETFLCLLELPIVRFESLSKLFLGLSTELSHFIANLSLSQNLDLNKVIVGWNFFCNFLEKMVIWIWIFAVVVSI